MILQVSFFRTETGTEPVRVWLKSLPVAWRKMIGTDVKTVQFGWPLGMPLVRKLDKDLWEVRSKTGEGIARIVFTVVGSVMVLLHGFIKKSQKTPPRELHTARERLKRLHQEEQR